MYCSDSFSHIDAYRCSHEAQEILADRCALGTVSLYRKSYNSRGSKSLPAFGGNAESFVGHEALKVLYCCTLVWQNNGRENALYFSSVSFYDIDRV